MIVTFNLSDFPADVLRGYGIEARHPDRFVADLLDQAPTVVHQAVRRQREALKNPPQTVEQLLDTLQRQRLPQTVARLRAAVDQL